jgi:putative hemolysin
MEIGLEIVIVLLLIALNGLFALSELALVSVRRPRLAVLERKELAGAAQAREGWLRIRSAFCRQFRSVSPW